MQQVKQVKQDYELVSQSHLVNCGMCQVETLLVIVLGIWTIRMGINNIQLSDMKYPGDWILDRSVEN